MDRYILFAFELSTIRNILIFLLLYSYLIIVLNFIGQNKNSSSGNNTNNTNNTNKENKNEIPLPPELEHCDRALVEKIESEIVHTGQVVTFEEIAGLEFAKKCVNELICW